MNTMKRKLVHSKMGLIRSIAYQHGANVTTNGGWVYITMPNTMELRDLNHKIDDAISGESKCTTKSS